MSEENIRYLFTTFFVKEAEFPVKSVNVISFNTFRIMMASANLSKGLLKEQEGKLLTTSESVCGVEVLWEIAFACPDKEIKEQAGNFLIALNSQVGKGMVSALPRLAEKFYSNALKKAKDKENMAFAIRLISLYIKGEAESAYTKIDKAQYYAAPTISIKAEVKRFDKKPTFIAININKTLSIGHLKNAISATLKLPLREFKVRHKRKKAILDESYNKEVIGAAFFNDSGAQLTVEGTKPAIAFRSTPFFVIANSERERRRLLKLMKQNEGYAEQLWKVMKDFVSIEERSFPDGSVQDWENELNPKKDIYRFLCNIYSVKELVRPKEFDEEAMEVKVKGAARQGLVKYLIEKYGELVKEFKRDDYIRLRTLNYIVKILYTLIVL